MCLEVWLITGWLSFRLNFKKGFKPKLHVNAQSLSNVEINFAVKRGLKQILNLVFRPTS